MAPHSFNALTLAHKFVRSHVKIGDLCIDATAGRGGDTALLCELVGAQGRVIAFDIQQSAIDSTTSHLRNLGFIDRANIALESHANMDIYAEAESVSCIMFNFGWLPSGDHSVFTKPESSTIAIEKGLTLLAPDGVMSLCIYYGGESGFEEKDALLLYLRTIDPKHFTVLICDFANRANCPPIAVFITREL